MKPLRYIAIFAAFNALVIFNSAHAAQSKEHTSKRGGNADTHMSTRGQENTNAQWFADPDRGWVRADERHDLHRSEQGNGREKKPRAKKTNERKGASY